MLPKVLDTIGFRRGLLLGHSDGASIAAIYAGSRQDHRVLGVVMIAPHFIVEDISVDSIAGIKTAYETTELRAKLARWHKDVDNAFYGWNGAWLDPNSATGNFRVSRLYPRPGGDHPGRVRPVRDHAAGRDCARRVLLSGRCDGNPRGGTSPHREAPGATLDAITSSQARCCATTRARTDGPHDAFPAGRGSMNTQPSSATICRCRNGPTFPAR